MPLDGFSIPFTVREISSTAFWALQKGFYEVVGPSESFQINVYERQGDL